MFRKCVNKITIGTMLSFMMAAALVMETLSFSVLADGSSSDKDISVSNQSLSDINTSTSSGQLPEETSIIESYPDKFTEELPTSVAISVASSEEKTEALPTSGEAPMEDTAISDSDETTGETTTAASTSGEAPMKAVATLDSGEAQSEGAADLSSSEEFTEESMSASDAATDENATVQEVEPIIAMRMSASPEPMINSIMTEETDTSDHILKIWNPSVTEMKAGVWSSDGKQDDLVWYKMFKNNEGWWECRIMFSNFKHGGKAFAHCYSGKTFANGIAFENPLSHVISKSGEGAADRVVTISDPLALLKAPRLAVWTLEGGQDDLRWYNMSKNGSSWSYTIPSKNLAHGGMVAVHCYDGMSYVIGTGYEVPVKYPISVTEVSGKHETITVTDDTGYLSSLKAAVWSDTGGQDDLKWYTMSKNSKGEWTCDALRSNLAHGGKVIVHCYSDKSFIAGITYQTPANNYISVSGSGSETRKLTISNSSSLYNSMRAAVWSTINGQDDIIWYEMEKSGSEWSADLLLSNLESAGRVAVHCYSGNIFVNGAEFSVSEEDFMTNLESRPKATGIYAGAGYKRYVVTNNYNYANSYNVLASYATVEEAQAVILKQPVSTMAEWYIYDTLENKVVVNYETPLAKTVAWAVAIANDPSHGYGCIGEQTPDNYKIDYARWGKYGDYSCSTLVAMAYELSGIENMRHIAKTYNVQCNYGTGVNFTSFAEILTISDKFHKISLGNYKAGDILISGHHVAMSIGNGYIVEAAMNELGQEFAVPTPGDQTGSEIRVTANYGGWISAFRSIVA